MNVPGYSQTPVLYLNEKLAGYTLQAGDPIVTFKSQAAGTKILFINFPYEQRRVTSLRAGSLVPGDLSLIKMSDGSSIGIDSIEMNPYGDFGALHLNLHQTLEQGQQYQLRMSNNASGNEITLPGAVSDNYAARIVEKDASRNSLSEYSFYHVALVNRSAAPNITSGGVCCALPILTGQLPIAQQQPAANAPVVVVPLALDALKVTDEKEADGSIVTKVAIDGGKLSQVLSSTTLSATTQVVIDINIASNAATFELPASALAAAPAAANTLIVVKTETASYSLPVQLLNVAGIAASMGVDIKALNISVTLEKVSGTAADQVAAKAREIGATLLGDSMDFTVMAQAGGKSVEISNFGNVYVARTIVLGQSVDQQQTPPFGTTRIRERCNSYRPSLAETKLRPLS